MPNNENPWVKELLSWHSHDRGGVHVPFQAASNPYGTVIVTGLVQRLRELAQQIGSGVPCPRWIFLIGGPGNGKSETVEDFLRALDEHLGMLGQLVSRLTIAFSPTPLVPRRVEVTAADVAGAPGSFAHRVGRLVIVQDATATDDALGNAAKQLATDVFDLLTTPENPRPVFVACTNRGLLSRVLKEAHSEYSGDNTATKLFTGLIRASSLGLETLKTNRPACWPLQDHSEVACWPLDQESLLVSAGTASPPVNQILVKATELPLWEAPGRCIDCDSAPVCPFRQNAEWLRDATRHQSLSRILRHGELATGQRWSFRDAFSLAADLLVGEWGDFIPVDHPCKWVHGHSALGGAEPTPETVNHSLNLLRRLYPHALFPVNWLRAAAEQLDADVGNFAERPFSEAFIQEIGYEAGKHTKPIREKLLKEYARLDPATYSPASADHVLHKVETEYSQSVPLGNGVPRNPPLTMAEQRFLQCLEHAESEWDLLGRDSAVATRFVHLLRAAASIVVKRSLAARLGHHAFESELQEFASTIRDIHKLNLLKDALQQILGKDRFRFNLVESYGQPAAEEDKLIVLDGPKPGLRTYVAPSPSTSAPAHDVPCFSIGSGSAYRIPITFDFFLALTLRSAGCANSSLPASVRAAIDRVRHRYAGELCRKTEAFADGTAQILLGGKMAITLPDETSPPAINPL
jgi:hypothetical protein